jgi:hypothetical protein
MGDADGELDDLDAADQLAVGVAERLAVFEPGNAALAASTAACSSAPLASGASATCSPVAGLNTGEVRPLVPATRAPLM